MFTGRLGRGTGPSQDHCAELGPSSSPHLLTSALLVYLSLSQGSEAQAMEKLLSTWPSLALHPHSVKPFHWQCGWRTVWSKGQCDLGALAGRACRMEYHPFPKQALGELG